MMFMKAKKINCGARALTRIEVLSVIASLALLSFLFFSALANARKNSSKIGCVTTLKQVSLGLRIWAKDDNDKYPMQVSTNQGGSLEWVGSKQVYRHFMAAGNEIGSPKVLICPQDRERIPAMSFSNLVNENISYFINLTANASNDHPQLVSGDRHLTRNGIQYSNGSYLISTQQVLTWGLKPHEHGGNIALTDLSVQQTRNETLQSAIINAQSPTNWLAFP